MTGSGWGRWGRPVAGCGAMCVLLLAAAWTGAAGQDPDSARVEEARAVPPLDQVEALARSGRAQEARVRLTEWWEDERPEAPREELQKGIWLRALLTVDPAQATLDYRRLMVEYPTGPYTPPALARMARAAEVLGDAEEARTLRELLVERYPRTPEAERARARLRGGGGR